MAKIIKIHPDNPHERAILQVVEVLEKGGVIIFPSDTVYALGCDTSNLKAMQRLAQIKGKKLEKSHFSIICNNLSHLSKFTKPIDTRIYKLLKRALPGSFTFIMNASKELPQAYKGKKTVGIRVPNHKVPQEIVTKLGSPISSTSIHNNEDDFLDYITDPEMLKEKFDNLVDLIIDSGTGNTDASTIVDLSKEEIEVIREGKEDINTYL